MPDPTLNDILFDQYRLTERLGDGPAGLVFKAEDTRLFRTVVIRFLPATLTADPAAFARFNRDLRAASALNHPSITAIYEIRLHHDRWCIITAFADGVPLSQLLTLRRIDPSQRFYLALALADALAGALRSHAASILHRHLNPATIFITHSGAPLILNFGLAALAEPPVITAPTPATLAYQSPEQILGHQPDARSDIYSFGAVLYALCTNRPPFAADTPAALREAILTQTPASPYSLNSDIKPRFIRIILKALEKDPSLRYPTIAHLRDDLLDSNSRDPSEPILG